MHRRHAGYSLLEIMIVIAISAVILMATFTVIFAVTRSSESLTPRVQLQLEATRVLREMCALLKQAGPSETIIPGTIPPKGDGVWQPQEYPAFAVYTPTAGFNAKWDPAYGFLNGNNLSVTPNAPNDTDIYPTYTNTAGQVLPLDGTQTVEIAFRIPKWNDGRKTGPYYPTDPNSGQVEWGTDIIAFVLVPGQIAAPGQPNSNELQVRYYNAKTQILDRKQVLTRDVERIVFQVAPGSFYAGALAGTPYIDTLNTLQGDECRVTLYFWKQNMNGQIFKLRQSSTFNFRSITR